MNKIILISGATSGIGEACATKFAAEKFDLVLTGRRAEKLKTLKKSLEKIHNIEVMTLCFDVQNKIETFEAVNNLPDAWKKISILINNAGLALGREAFDEAEMTDWDTMMHT
ncbi:MAG: SDR family NAD(P)-dependent oxidoreductase, partial [Ferruginibacter sp.]